MTSGDPRERVEAALSQARAARAAGQPTTARRALAQASAVADELEPSHPLRQVVAWRIAKLDHDLGDPDAAIASLAWLLEGQADPFEHYEAGLGACLPLANAAWNHAGYGRPGIRRLLQRGQEGHEHRGDRYQAHHLQLQLAWDVACAGEAERLGELLASFGALLPRHLEGGPTRHPRASDAAGSVAWLQLDMARTALRAGTWGQRTDLVDDAEDLFEEAADGAGIDRAGEYWFLEPIAVARLRLERADPDDYVGAWLRLAPTLEHARSSYHRALARAAAAISSAARASALQDASRQARFGAYGPEWEIDPALQAARITGAWPHVAAALVDSHGVGIFRGVLDSLSGGPTRP